MSECFSLMMVSRTLYWSGHIFEWMLLCIKESIKTGLHPWQQLWVITKHRSDWYKNGPLKFPLVFVCCHGIRKYSTAFHHDSAKPGLPIWRVCLTIKGLVYKMTQKYSASKFSLDLKLWMDWFMDVLFGLCLFNSHGDRSFYVLAQLVLFVY